MWNFFFKQESIVMEVVSIWLKNAVEQFTWRLSLQLGEITLVIICGYSQLPDIPILPFRVTAVVRYCSFWKLLPILIRKFDYLCSCLASKSNFCHFKVAFLEIIQNRNRSHFKDLTSRKESFGSLTYRNAGSRSWLKAFYLSISFFVRWLLIVVVIRKSYRCWNSDIS